MKSQHLKDHFKSFPNWITFIPGKDSYPNYRSA